MTYSLAWLRYILLVSAALGTLFIGDLRPSSYPLFTITALLLIGVAQLADKRERLMQLLIVVELTLAVWLNVTFGGLYFISFFSTLILLFRPPLGFHWPRLTLFGLCWTGLAFSIAEQSHIFIAGIHFLFAAFSVLMYKWAAASGRSREVEQLYDELRRKHYELEEARSRLVDYARKVQLISQMEERNRIAHDLHDDLGHSITRLKMMMEAAIRLADSQPEKTYELMNQVRDQLGSSMESLRRTVRRLQPDEQLRGQYSLHKLIEEASGQFGIPVSLQTSGVPYPLYPSIEFALYRNVQEAITNAIRHGGARSIDIRMRYEPQRVVLSISNDGDAPEEDPLARPGLGINGMQERVKLLGGSLSVETGPPFTVTTIVPHPAGSSYFS